MTVSLLWRDFLVASISFAVLFLAVSLSLSRSHSFSLSLSFSSSLSLPLCPHLFLGVHQSSGVSFRASCDTSHKCRHSIKVFLKTSPQTHPGASEARQSEAGLFMMVSLLRRDFLVASIRCAGCFSVCLSLSLSLSISVSLSLFLFFLDQL